MNTSKITNRYCFGLAWIRRCYFRLDCYGVHLYGFASILPIHYNILGKPDGYGNKMHVLALPIVSTFLYVGISILNRFPHVFNYPVDITEKNANYQYALATRFLRYLKFILVILFEFIIYNIASQTNLRIWFLPCILGLVFIPLLYYIYKAKYSNPD
ncbi:MAG: DUF1648 domain-containing protein [Sphingobacteriia bacterium]|nr:DUF1648 domain-containing protein [Sphingobacteriia bacterium]